jgi:hypothetical protein
MTEPQVIGDIEIGQNLPFQRKMWRAQRITWVVMLILAVLIFLGLFGDLGALNNASASNNKVAVKYQPFVHRIQPIDLDVNLHQLSGTSAQLLVSRDFIQKYQVQQITPVPDSVTTKGNMLAYQFSLSPGSQDMDIEFNLQTNKTALGNVSGEIGPSQATLVKINQFVYP